MVASTSYVLIYLYATHLFPFPEYKVHLGKDLDLFVSVLYKLSHQVRIAYGGYSREDLLNKNELYISFW